MSAEPSLWVFVLDAGLVVKVVLFILFLASVISWSIIIQRTFLFKRNFLAFNRFEQYFWSGADMKQIFEKLQSMSRTSGLASLFQAGFKEFSRLVEDAHIKDTDRVMEATRRSMRIAQAREMARLEKHLTFLATVGSVSPYVGLFGTVWGIMTSFRALGSVQQATISMVAPGISEALIATAVGLFAAIPAVIAYNRFSHQLELSYQKYEIFQEELTGILQRNLLQRSAHDTAI